MDITSFVVQGRDQALLYGDYSTYHSQLSKRLLSSRKKLSIATKNRGKFHKKEAVTADNIAEDREYVHLLLLSSERAWAQAMAIKSAHSTGRKGIVGRTRSHIVSRLNKATHVAHDLVEALGKVDASVATTRDVLEAKAYEAIIQGAMLFEKHAWEPCLRSYATARVIYSALATTGKADLFKDLLADTIDPSIRYAAYQLKTPRTIPIPTIARKAFPTSDSTLVEQVNSVDPGALSGESDEKAGLPTGDSVPKTLTWRTREVKIEDAQIALAWASVKAAKERLAQNLQKSSDKTPREAAAAYDEILTATQDAVDATKQAIDDLRGEGVSQSDPRMQSLQITRTAVNYEMISWRIGRNRVLTGEQDGAIETHKSTKKGKKADAEDDGKVKELPVSRKLTKLKETAALYDGTLQNLESIRELPGVAADQGLSAKLDAFVSYFKALKCLSVARSHAIVGNVANALALINHSFGLCESAAELSKSGEAPAAANGPLNIEVSSDAVNSLARLVNGELQRHRAIVHIDNLRKAEQKNSPATAPALIERLHEYPVGGVDFANIVEFPPQKSLIPMKPIFLDVAWNYISYPGKTPVASAAAPSLPATGAAPEAAPAPAQKKGWFGFGR